MTSADLQATVAHMGMLARAASRALAALAGGGAQRRAARAGAAAARRATPTLRDGQCRRPRRGARRRPGRAAGRSPEARRRRARDRRPGLRADRGDARPDRRDHRLRAAAERHPRRPMRVPIGVFGMIYESRPNVTIEAASLAIKSGNACILRGGSEAIDSNLALARLVQAGARRGRPAARRGAAGRRRTDRAAVGHLIAMPRVVDVIIPRGGKGLIERIAREAKVPVHQAPRRQLPRLRRRRCRPRDGADDRRQRQDAEVQPVQRRRVAARARRGRGATFLPTIGAVFARQGRRDARRRRGARRARAASPAPSWSPRPKPTGARNTSRPIISIKVVDGARRGDRAHQPLRLAPHRRDRHRRDHANAHALPARGRFGERDGQRQRRASPTASSTASAPRSASAPTSCTRAARSASKA